MTERRRIVKTLLEATRQSLTLVNAAVRADAELPATDNTVIEYELDVRFGTLAAAEKRARNAIEAAAATFHAGISATMFYATVDALATHTGATLSAIEPTTHRMYACDPALRRETCDARDTSDTWIRKRSIGSSLDVSLAERHAYFDVRLAAARELRGTPSRALVGAIARHESTREDVRRAAPCDGAPSRVRKRRRCLLHFEEAPAFVLMATHIVTTVAECTPVATYELEAELIDATRIADASVLAQQLTLVVDRVATALGTTHQQRVDFVDRRQREYNGHRRDTAAPT